MLRWYVLALVLDIHSSLHVALDLFCSTEQLGTLSLQMYSETARGILQREHVEGIPREQLTTIL
jgi:hypothetical protein